MREPLQYISAKLGFVFALPDPAYPAVMTELVGDNTGPCLAATVTVTLALSSALKAAITTTSFVGR